MGKKVHNGEKMGKECITLSNSNLHFIKHWLHLGLN